MGKDQFISQLEALTQQPGFVYILSILLMKDLFLEASEAADIDWKERISFQEFVLLIGLMVKQPIDLKPITEEIAKDTIPKIYSLFSQLHRAHMKPIAERMAESIEEHDPDKLTDEERTKIYSNLFGSGEFMIESIFYAESGAYDFQYLELAPQRYRYDAEWLQKECCGK